MVKASLIWLNYNSLSFIDIALKSIDSLLNLDFDEYEVIIVDNASNDGSFEKIKNYVEEHRPSDVRVKFVISNVNRGYAGGNNLGWEARDPESKYAVFLNNDLIVELESLKKIIDYMEGEENLAAANGILYSLKGSGSRRIYAVGGFVTDLWISGDICYGIPEHECPGIDKPHYVTYADGAYMVVKVDAIRSVCPDGKPFIDETFIYLDDDLLGLILWNRGYRVAYVPVRAGVHLEGMTVGRHGIGFYYFKRASTMRFNIVKTKFYAFRHLYIVRRFIGYSLLSITKWHTREMYMNMLKGVRDGLRAYNLIKNKVGILNLYKAPYVPVSVTGALVEYITFGIRKPYKTVTFDMLKQPQFEE
jgi:GT2 family glycosyltransferase